MMTSSQVVKTSVATTSNSPFQDYSNPDDQSSPSSDDFFVVSLSLSLFKGEEKMNLTGMVKYVSKVGSGGSIFVGLKVDHPGKEAIIGRTASRHSFLAVLNGRIQ